MLSRPIYAISGLLVGAAVDIVINLLAAGIQQQAFATQFSGQALWILAGLAVFGLLLGYWLGAQLNLPTPPLTQPTPSGQPETITITRFRALLSYGRLKGKGIHLSDIVLLGSRIDIET
ncbi:MAG TPA: hypothetical protein VIZ18_13700 [Ktedonobacteraceae bacterium]